MILYHAITCDEDECDPPRTVDNAPRLPVVLDGCPIGDPAIPAPAASVRISLNGGEPFVVTVPDSWMGPGGVPMRFTRPMRADPVLVVAPTYAIAEAAAYDHGLDRNWQAVTSLDVGLRKVRGTRGRRYLLATGAHAMQSDWWWHDVMGLLAACDAKPLDAP